MEGDSTLNPHLFGSITGAGDDPTFSTGNNRLTPEFWVDGLFTGRKEGVTVDVKNRLWP
jgi:hypothetical protein